MKIGWFSCEDRSSTAVGLFNLVAEEPQLVLNQGDTPYLSDFRASFRGQTTVSAVYNSTVSEIYAHHQQVQADPGFAALQRWRTVNSGKANRLLYYMPDDHDRGGGDDWDHTITQAQSQTPIGGSVGGIPSQAEVDAHWWVCTQAAQQAIAAYSDNPTNIDNPSRDKPASAAAGTASSQYPVIYFRQGFSYAGVAQAAGVSGDIEVFVIDCISGRSPIADVDDASKKMLGTNQFVWLKNRLLASTATWKIISTGKATRASSGGDNSDTWGAYSYQLSTTDTGTLTSIEKFIDSNSITGVIWLAGDKHVPHVISQKKSAGDTYDHVCITACPISVSYNVALTGTMNGIVWQGPQHMDSQCYGLIDISSTEAKIYIKRARDGGVLWTGKVAAGTNYLAAPTSALRFS